jgi:ApaG protein
MNHIKELEGLSVNIDKVVYMPALDAPEDRPHPFVYFITIRNGAGIPVTIVGRKWVIAERSGNRNVLEGDGVVGKKPRIEPGDSFSYNSYHAVAGDADAEGAFIGVTDDGTPVATRIPRFTMSVPRD